METKDLLINWPDGEKHLKKILKQKGFYLNCMPSKIDFKKNSVGIVQSGIVKCVFYIRGFKHTENAIFPAGKINGKFNKGKGYFFSIFKIKITEIKPRIAGFNAFGALRYYDLNKDIAFNFSGSKINNISNYVDKIQYIDSETFKSKPFNFKGTSIIKNSAEKALVNAYVKYCKLENHVLHPYLKTDRHYADLFDKSKWRLIEAKSIVDRKTIREALGQLLDYKREYNRKPSLGILLPEKPSQSIIEFLNHYKVTVIWEKERGKGNFYDSSNGNWTTKNRRLIN